MASFMSYKLADGKNGIAFRVMSAGTVQVVFGWQEFKGSAFVECTRRTLRYAYERPVLGPSRLSAQPLVHPSCYRHAGAKTGVRMSKRRAGKLKVQL